MIRTSGAAARISGTPAATANTVIALLNAAWVRAPAARSFENSRDSTGSAPANIAPGAIRANVPNRAAAANAPSSASVER